MKRILIACEYSGIIRDAFRKRGFDAWSCDVLPCESDPTYHLHCDVLEILDQSWDLMIAHPPCTYLSYAGIAFWKQTDRVMKRIEAASFFMLLYRAPIPHICVENPQGVITHLFRKPDQIIHPYYFGEPIVKKTCLWLKNLPKLYYSFFDDLFHEKKTACKKPEPAFQYTKKDGTIKREYFTYTTRSPHKRSKSFQSIGETMAVQWGDFLNKQE